jgi:hypothetical protein
MICPRRAPRYLFALTPQGVVPIAAYTSRREMIEQAEHALSQGFTLTERTLDKVARASMRGLAQ